MNTYSQRDIDEILVDRTKKTHSVFWDFLFEEPTRMGPDEKCLNRHREVNAAYSIANQLSRDN